MMAAPAIMQIMIDPITKADVHLPELVKYMTDWQRCVQRLPNRSVRIQNVYWQVAYIELLKCFAASSLLNGHMGVPLPDFEKLAMMGFPDREEKSSMEKRVHELS